MPRALAAAAVAFALALGADRPLRGGSPDFPPLSLLPVTPFTLQDAGLAAAGLRAAAADLAWIQLLQYGANSLPEMTDSPGKPYEHIAVLTRRVTHLDPSFHRAWLYGAGILGWFENVNRPDEAVELLREGMRLDPGQPLYGFYIAALAYKKSGNVDKEIAILEGVFDDPRTPATMRPILANIYRRRGEYAKALATWERILDNPRDASEHPRAVLAIPELRRLIREKRR